MLLTHNKGPWARVEFTVKGVGKILIVDRDGRDLADIKSDNLCTIALIEHAPEVLKALQALIWDYQLLAVNTGQSPNMSRAFKRAKRAIEMAAPMVNCTMCKKEGD